MYIYYDKKKNKIIKISKDKLNYGSKDIFEFQLDEDINTIFHFELDIDLENKNVKLKSIDSVKKYMINIFESLIEKTISDNFKDWGLNYNEIMQESQSTAMYLETKILYVLTTFIQIDIFNLRRDTFNLLNNIIDTGKRVITKDFILSYIDNFVTDNYIQNGVDEKYKEFLIDSIMKYMSAILIINLSEEMWDYLENFESDIKEISSYSDLNNLYMEYLNIINNVILKYVTKIKI